MLASLNIPGNDGGDFPAELLLVEEFFGGHRDGKGLPERKSTATSASAGYIKLSMVKTEPSGSLIDCDQSSIR